MITQIKSNQLFSRSKKALQSSIAKFEKEIISQFEKSFNQLDASYQHKYSQVINKQKEEIRQLRSDLLVFQKMRKMIIGTAVIDNPVNTAQKNQEKQTKIQQKTDKRYDKIQRKESKEKNPLIQRKSLQSSKRFNKRQKEQELISVQSDSQPEHSQINKIMTEKQSFRIQSNRTDKPILQTSKQTTIAKVSFKPNLTRLQYLQYQSNMKYVFSAYDVFYLSKFDLSHIQSIKIQYKQMADQDFDNLTKLSLQNIRSLQIDGNRIENLTPLKNLPLNKLINLDVSMNPLNLSSAQFLANQQFDELVYLTLSFDTGINDQCWEILLRNGMSNFPRLEAIDICNSNQLSDKIKQRIIECLKSKSQQQRKRSFMDKNGELQPYPIDYQIKVTWQSSKQLYETLSEQQMTQIQQKWIKQVDYKRQVIPAVKRKQIRNSKAKAKGRERQKEREIKRGRGRPRKKGRKIRIQNQHDSQNVHSQLKKDSNLKRRLIYKRNRNITKDREKSL